MYTATNQPACNRSVFQCSTQQQRQDPFFIINYLIIYIRKFKCAAYKYLCLKFMVALVLLRLMYCVCTRRDDANMQNCKIIFKIVSTAYIIYEWDESSIELENNEICVYARVSHERPKEQRRAYSSCKIYNITRNRRQVNIQKHRDLWVRKLRAHAHSLRLRAKL